MKTSIRKMRNIRVKRSDGKRGMICAKYLIYQYQNRKYKLVINWSGYNIFFFVVVDNGCDMVTNRVPAWVLQDFMKRINL
jgi:hypothetical protein